jgi:DNA replication protein DnaC
MMKGEQTAMNELILDHLKKLQLNYLVQNFDDFVSSFKRNKDVALSIITKVCELEIQQQQKRNLERRLRESKVGRFKPMADFDWNWPKKIDRPAIERLFDLKFIEEGRNVVIIGPPGVGKTMIAKNLAYSAAVSGNSSLCCGASDLVNDLNSALSAQIYKSRLNRFVRRGLLVIDEFGYLSFNNKAADLLYKVISKKYEKNSLIITTNLAFDKWGTVFPGATCVSALIDRLTHRCELITIDADSYRLKESKEKNKLNNQKRREKK